MDAEKDGLDELYKYKRKPLNIEWNLQGGGAFRALGVHLKSKDIFNALEWAA